VATGFVPVARQLQAVEITLAGFPALFRLARLVFPRHRTLTQRALASALPAFSLQMAMVVVLIRPAELSRHAFAHVQPSAWRLPEPNHGRSVCAALTALSPAARAFPSGIVRLVQSYLLQLVDHGRSVCAALMALNSAGRAFPSGIVRLVQSYLLQLVD